MHHVGLSYFYLDDYSAAERALQERISQHPSTDSSRVLLAALYGRHGQHEKALAIWSELTKMFPDYSFSERLKVWPYTNPDAPRQIIDGLLAAGIRA